MEKNRTYFKIITAVFALLVIIGYTLYETRNYFTGPSVTVVSPTNGATLNEPLVEILGVAINTGEIFLNGQRILANDKGEFKERLLLAEGYNIIGLRVEDKFKRTAEQRLELVYKK